MARLSRANDSDEDLPCQECGGALVSGAVAFPVLGAPKFSYRLKTVDVSVDVGARMCDTCGLVVFRVADPGPIREARAAVRRADNQPTTPWTRKRP